MIVVYADLINRNIRSAFFGVPMQDAWLLHKQPRCSTCRPLLYVGSSPISCSLGPLCAEYIASLPSWRLLWALFTKLRMMHFYPLPNYRLQNMKDRISHTGWKALLRMHVQVPTLLSYGAMWKHSKALHGLKCVDLLQSGFQMSLRTPVLNTQKTNNNARATAFRSIYRSIHYPVSKAIKAYFKLQSLWARERGGFFISVAGLVVRKK